MLALGAKKEHMGAMDIDHIFISRLRLLIIMLKAYLRQYPMGSYRLQGMLHNARIVGDEAVYLWELSEKPQSIPSTKEAFQKDRKVFEHIKALALFAEKIEPGRLPDRQMIESIRHHLDYLNRHIISERRFTEWEFLKVA